MPILSRNLYKPLTNTNMPQKHNLRSKKLEWHTEYRKVNGLLPYSKNPRQITDKQLDKDFAKELTKKDIKLVRS